eukprot:814472_1
MNMDTSSPSSDDCFDHEEPTEIANERNNGTNDSSKQKESKKQKDVEDCKNDEPDRFQCFIDELKASYVPFDKANLATTEDEKKWFETHNELEQHLFDAAHQIQLSNTLSSSEKLVKRKQIACMINDYVQNIIQTCEQVPSDIITNNDGSAVMECALKRYRPSREVLMQIISMLHSGRLDPSNAMQMVMFQIQSNLQMEQFNQIIRAYAVSSNYLDLKSSIFNKDEDGGQSNVEDIQSDVTKIVDFLWNEIYNEDQTKNRPKGSSTFVRFDPSYKTNKYFVSDTLEKVMCGKLRFGSGYGPGQHYHMDCAGDLLAICGGSGWKYRDPSTKSYFIHPTTHKMKRIGRSNRGFASTGRTVYCDAIHNRIWSSGDGRVKCSGIIENGKDINGSLSAEYILDASSISGRTLFTTKENVFMYSNKGIFYRWSLNKLFKHTEDIYAEHEDDNIPDKDKHGIATVPGIFQNTWSDLEFVKVEVSGGQKPESCLKLKEPFEIDEDSNHNDCSMIAMSGKSTNLDHMFVTNKNIIYSYDLNKQNVNGMLLGHNCDARVALRQHLIESHHLLVSHDYNMVKVWDIRTCAPQISIKASGMHCLNSCVGFNVSGNSFIASGGNDECVTVWDIRNVNAKRNGALYEISTGNNNVDGIVWHESSNSLFAMTDCLYIDRFGRKYYGTNHELTDDYDDDEVNDWPERAKHRKTDFPCEYDSAQNDVFRFRF